MSFEHEEFERLRNSIQGLQRKHETFVRKFLLEMGLRAMRKVKKLTPVDTGQLRNAWELSDVFRRGGELYIVLSNATMYASAIEDGRWNKSRTKFYEGYHMARVSIHMIELELPTRYDKAFKQFMAGLR